MARERKVKPIRLFDRGYFVVNVKLVSGVRSGPDAYREIFLDTWRNRVRGKITADRVGIFRSFFSPNEDMLYGTICQFVNIVGDKWVNLQNMAIEGQEIPADKFPNSREVEFVFYPSVHRLGIRKGGAIGLAAVVRFLREALLQSCNDGEEIVVLAEQSADGFEEIYKAESVSSMRVEITPPNGDTTEDAGAIIEEELRKLNSQGAILEVKAQKGQTLKPQDSLVASGFLQLAQSNGSVVARVVDEQGKNRTIKTQDHPAVFNLRVPKNQIEVERDQLRGILLDRFRGNADS